MILRRVLEFGKYQGFRETSVRVCTIPVIQFNQAIVIDHLRKVQENTAYDPAYPAYPGCYIRASYLEGLE